MINMLPVSRLIAGAALRMGGSDVLYYRPTLCPYIHEDGTPCYNEDRGSPDIECPLCHGDSAIFAHPVPMRAIYSDDSDKFVPDGSGGFIQGMKTLAITHDFDISLMKERVTENARRYVRDKFEVLGQCCEPDGSRRVLMTLYLDEDPVSPFISSGPIYHIIKVKSNWGH